MKKVIPAIAALCSIAVLLNSCAASQASVHAQKSEITDATETSATCFIQLNDGTIKQYTSLKLVTGVLTSPHLLADNKEVINSKDIMAYQDNRHYAVAAKILTSKRNSYVAAETLPGFAVKVIAGKLNVYCRKYYNGANAVDEYFLQNGNDGYIVAYSKTVLKSMLKEDTKALEYFNSKVKTSFKSKKLLTAVEMYNNSRLLTKN